MGRFSVALILVGTFFVPATTAAETSDATRVKVAESLKEALEFTGVPTEVVITGCKIEITSLYLQTCMVAAVEKGQKRIDLSEVKEIKLSPFRDHFAINVELFVARPSPITFFLDWLLLGKEEHFRKFSEEHKRAIGEANLQSGETFWMCDGSISQQAPATFLTLFVDRQPAEWLALEQLNAECKKP